MTQQYEQLMLLDDGPAEATVATEAVGAVVQQLGSTPANRYANGFNLVGPGQAEAAQRAMAEYRRIRDEQRVTAAHG